MQPNLDLGPITLKTFGLAFALAFIAVGALAARRFKELGKPADWAYEIAFAALIGGLVGSRLYFIVQNYDQVKHDLLGNLFGGSGLVWYGGVIGGAIAVCCGRAGGDARPRPARLRRAAARAGLRDRADRLPGLRRRRLRHPLRACRGRWATRTVPSRPRRA